jgi:hypothetical protein
MKYAAIHRAYMTREPALLAEDDVIGAWARLSSAAADREEPAIDLDAAVKDGRVSEANPIGDFLLRGARRWTDRHSYSVAHVTTAAIEKTVEAGLCRWEGDDLVVTGGDLWGLAKVRAARTNGRRGGRPKGRAENRPVNLPGNPSVNREAPPTPKPVDSPQGGPSPLPSLPSPPLPNRTTPTPTVPAVTARTLIDTFNRVRGEHGHMSPWHPPTKTIEEVEKIAMGLTAPGGPTMNEVEQTIRTIFDDQLGGEHGDLRNPSYAFGVWRARHPALLDELRGGRRPAAARKRDVTRGWAGPSSEYGEGGEQKL